MVGECSLVEGSSDMRADIAYRVVFSVDVGYADALSAELDSFHLAVWNIGCLCDFCKIC